MDINVIGLIIEEVEQRRANNVAVSVSKYLGRPLQVSNFLRNELNWSWSKLCLLNLLLGLL